MSNTCINKMALNVANHGVDPNAYSLFVDSTVNTLNPANNVVGITFANTLAATTMTIVVFAIILVLFAFFVMIILLASDGRLSNPALVGSLAMGAVIAFLFYVLARSYSLSTSYDVLPS